MKKNYKKNNYNKIQRFSIRKYSFGAASVAIATYLMFMGNGAVYAAQEGGTTESTEPKAGKVVGQKAEETAEEKAQKELAASKEKLAASKEKLAKYVTGIEGNLSSGKYDSKTKESLAILRGAIAEAKQAASATTIAEVENAHAELVTTVTTKLESKEKKEAPKGNTTDRAATAAKHEPTTVNVGNLSYTLEFSDDTKKEIYAYNEEDADISIAVNSTAGKITSASVKSASGQYMNKNKKQSDPLEAQEIDGFGWMYTSIVNDTQGPATLKITGKPNDTFKKLKDYTKDEKTKCSVR